MNIAISIFYMFPTMLALCWHYAESILNAFNDPLCPKLCWLNKWILLIAAILLHNVFV